MSTQFTPTLRSNNVDTSSRLFEGSGLVDALRSRSPTEFLRLQSARRWKRSAELDLISIDPFQEEHWKNIGLLNLERSGYLVQTTFYPSLAEVILPKLVETKTEIDFAYVDGSKIFDIALIQAHFLVKMLRVCGLLVFDACRFSGLGRAMRWLNSYPYLEFHSGFGPFKRSLRLRLVSAIVARLPGGASAFRPELIKSGISLNLSYQCIAFVKIAEDQRNYDWDHPL